MPTREKGHLVVLSHPVAPIGFDFQVSVPADVGEVSRDGPNLLAASRDLDHDFRGPPPNGSADLFDLSG